MSLKQSEGYAVLDALFDDVQKGLKKRNRKDPIGTIEMLSESHRLLLMVSSKIKYKKVKKTRKRKRSKLDDSSIDVSLDGDSVPSSNDSSNPTLA
jgi:hypothetical protein